ncbi:MAG: DNA polymerase III subunit delta' [Alphaproteobacteria bacterium]|nr:DNA polymerase III subunit delta' [Alphaproteobacteria bacterium]
MARAPAAPEPVDDSAHPRRAETVLGHEDALRRFAEAWTSGRMHHAWLICGQQGVGKATLAYHLAKAVLSDGISAGEPDMFGEPGAPSITVGPEDPAVLKVAAGSHPNLFVVERRINDKTKKLESAIPVDRVRQAVEFLRRTADGWKIVLVDSVDEMNRNAANAILKVLEEPPPRSLMLLVSHAPGRLLPTIRSRCRRLEVGPLPAGIVDGLLAKHLVEEDESERLLLAALSDGSAGKALDLAQAGGATLYVDLVKLLSTLPALDLRAAHLFADRVGQGPEAELRFQAIMTLLAGFLARLTRHAATGEPPVTYLREEEAIFTRLSGIHGLERWLALWENTRRLEARTLAVNLDKRQTVLTAILALMPGEMAA